MYRSIIGKKAKQLIWILQLEVVQLKISYTEHQKNKGYAAKTKEDEKRKKYNQICNEVNSLFFPIVVETHGCWGQEAIPILKRIANGISIYQNIPRSIAINNMLCKNCQLLYKDPLLK